MVANTTTVEWFLRDDPGYLAWLAAIPYGFVLNTWPHVSAGYLVLHKASCRTINRQLLAGKQWTAQYGKACAGTKAELVAWAVAGTNEEPADCAVCQPDSTRRSGGGSRRPITSTAPEVQPSFVGSPASIVVERMDGGPPLVLDGAQWLAETFFRFDASATGARSYDATTLTTDRDRFEDVDVTALNATMAARTGHAWWTGLFTQGPSPILARLGKEWDLLEATPEQWEREAMARNVADAIATMRGPHRQLAVITKMLHLKRPALVPVIDSLVIQQIGGRGRSDVQVLEHIRKVGRSNLDALLQIQAHLRGILGYDQAPIERTTVRIFDALLWSTHPASVLYPLLGKWRATIGLRERA